MFFFVTGKARVVWYGRLRKARVSLSILEVSLSASFAFSGHPTIELSHEYDVHRQCLGPRLCAGGVQWWYGTYGMCKYERYYKKYTSAIVATISQLIALGSRVEHA